MIFLNNGKKISGAYSQLRQHPIREMNDMFPLNISTVVGTAASQGFKGTHKKFKLYPGISQFYGKGMGSAVLVLKLEGDSADPREFQPRRSG